jgi:hypothetical protein
MIFSPNYINFTLIDSKSNAFIRQNSNHISENHIKLKLLQIAGPLVLRYKIL